MSNRLKMNEQHSIYKMKEMGWSNRRIARESGHHRKTVALLLAQGAKCTTNPPAGSPGVVHFAGESCPPGIHRAKPRFRGPKSLSEAYDVYIREQLELGVDAYNIYLRMHHEKNFTGAYSGVKRYVAKIKRQHPELVGRIVCSPGEEGQVDYGLGAPITDPITGKRRRPWLFKMVLGYSRHSYHEAVWHQTAEAFIRCHENAFRYFAGVVRLIRLDNLKAGILKGGWHDIETNPLYQAFANHYGFAIIPHRPRQPWIKGKVESGINHSQGGRAGKEFHQPRRGKRIPALVG